jgi:PadR family transcriptional regulator, regulatory protein AphA
MKNQETTELVILGILMKEAMHGYEINKFMSEYLDNIWHIGTSQIYLILQRLEKNKTVTGTIAFQENGMSKKIYAITVGGKEKFSNWVQRPTEHVRNIRTDFLAKLFFFDHLKLSGGLELIWRQIDLLEDLREKVENSRNSEQDGYRKIVLGFKLSQFDASISWLKADVGTYLQTFAAAGAGNSGFWARKGRK